MHSSVHTIEHTNALAIFNADGSGMAAGPNTFASIRNGPDESATPERVKSLYASITACTCGASAPKLVVLDDDAEKFSGTVCNSVAMAR